MHYDFVATNQKWDDRIEIAYLAVIALKTYRSHVSQIAVISPGEPFHVKEAGKDWLINWCVVRAWLIQNAIVWRDEEVDHEATFPETVRFVHFVIDRINERAAD